MNFNPQEAAARLNSGTLADVLDGHGFNGVITHQVGQLSGRQKNILAQAHTVHWERVRKGKSIMAQQDATWHQVKHFLLPEVTDGNGKVYVGGGAHLIQDMALAGGLSCTHFDNIGFEAVLLGGAVRDAQMLKTLDLPVLATNYGPADTQGAYRVAHTGQYCDIGEVRIHENDWIFIDQTGVVVIPQQLAQTVLQEALDIESVEDNMVERLRNGEHLFEIVEKAQRI